MGPVDVRHDIPEWATDYVVGDDIAFRNPQTATVEREPLAGFSTTDEYRGLPAVVCPPHLTSQYPNAGVLIITEGFHVPRDD